MTDAHEVPTAGQPAVHADRPKSQFEIGDVVVIQNEEVLDESGTHCEVATIIGDKRYVDGDWEYSGASKDRDGNSISQQYPERVLKKPRYAIGQRIRLARLPNSTNAGTVMGYGVDGCNALHYNIQRDMSCVVADQLVKLDG